MLRNTHYHARRKWVYPGLARNAYTYIARYLWASQILTLPGKTGPPPFHPFVIRRARKHFPCLLWKKLGVVR